MIALALLLSALILPAAGSAEVIDRIIATVNGHIILQSDWDEALCYEALLNGRALNQFTDEDRRAVLDRLIDQELLGEQMKSAFFEHASEAEAATRLADARKQYPEAATAEGWQAVLARFGLAEKDLVAHVQQQIDLMRLVDARLRPAVQIDSKTIEAYYRDKFVPQLKQSGASDAPSGRGCGQDPRVAHPGESQRADDLLAPVSALGKQSQRPRHGRVHRGGSTDAVTEPAARPRRWWKYLLIASGVGLLAVLAALWYITTDSFQSYVRRRVVAEVERITGGRAEVGTFHIVPFHMQVEVRNITVHGKESPSDVPLAHADSLVAQLKVISFLRTEFGFHSLTLDHPVVHISIGPDGSTNVPAPQVMQEPSANPPIEQLFALSIDHLTLRNGELLWGDQRIPLDLAVHDTGLEMDYSFLRGRYESHLALGKIDTTFQEFRPFAWSTTVDFSLGTTFADVKSLKWNSGRSSLEAAGRISDFRNPRVDAEYKAHVDLAEAAAIARRHDLRDGIAEFKGSGHWSLNDFSATGALALRDLGWQDNQIALKKASVTSDYSVTDEQIKLSKLQGKILGGTFAGDAQVDNWLHSIPPPPLGKVKKGAENLPVITAARPPAKKGEKVKLPGVQSGAVHLRLRDVSAADVAAALDVPAHPLGRFRPAGLATGTADAAWKGSYKDAEVGFALDVNPPPHLSAGELPVTATFAGEVSRRQRRARTDSVQLVYSRLAHSGFGDSGGFLDAAHFHLDFQPGRMAAAGHRAARAHQPAVPRGRQCHVQRRGQRHVFVSGPGRNAGRGGFRIHHACDLPHRPASGALGFPRGQYSSLFA